MLTAIAARQHTVAAAVADPSHRPVLPPAQRLRDTIDGPEKFCIACLEWWPADGEFFYPAKRTPDGLFYCCRACYREMRNSKHDADANPGRVRTTGGRGSGYSTPWP